jgi:hypothetical protein
VCKNSKKHFFVAKKLYFLNFATKINRHDEETVPPIVNRRFVFQLRHSSHRGLPAASWHRQVDFVQYPLR